MGNCGGCCDWAARWLHRNVPVDIYDTVECAGTSIGHETINLWYFIIFRAIFGLYVTIILFWSYSQWCFVDGNCGVWWVYITHWGLLFNTIYMWSTVILHWRVYSGIEKKLDGHTSIRNLGRYPSIDDLNLRDHWDWVLFLLNSSLSWSIFVIILYWALVYTGNFSILAVHTHGVAGGLVLLEWFTSCWQISYYGAIYVASWAAGWVVVSIIFAVSGATDPDGERYIYAALDWNKDSGAAGGLAVGIIIAMVLCHLLLVFVKSQILKCWVNSRTEEEKGTLIVGADSEQDGRSPGDDQL